MPAFDGEIRVAKLTKRQLEFISNQGIPLSSMFDASGLSKRIYTERMREQGKAFAFGVAPCAAEGHTLRTRAGHCIQCNTSNIAYMLRNIGPGYVYVAASLHGRLLKVGSCERVSGRQESLRSQRYGGHSDWEILAHAHFDQRGKVEGEIQKALQRWRVSGGYWKGDDWTECYELFVCKISRVIDLLKRFDGAAEYKCYIKIKDMVVYDFEGR